MLLQVPSPPPLWLQPGIAGLFCCLCRHFERFYKEFETKGKSTTVWSCSQSKRRVEHTLLDHSIRTCRRSNLCRTLCRCNKRARFLQFPESHTQHGHQLGSDASKFAAAMQARSVSSSTCLRQAVPAKSDQGFVALHRPTRQRSRLTALAAPAAERCLWPLPSAGHSDLTRKDLRSAAAPPRGEQASRRFTLRQNHGQMACLAPTVQTSTAFRAEDDALHCASS